MRGVLGKTLNRLFKEERQQLMTLKQDLEDIKQRIENVAFYVDMTKNADTVTTGENEALTRIFTGQKMYLDTRDLSVAPHIMLDGVWERGITAVWRESIDQGSIVVDIGANFGWFGVVAGAESSKVEAIHFVEANPHLCPYIRKSCNVNGLLAKATISNVAIADKPGKVELNFLEDYWGSSSLHDIEKSFAGSKLGISTREKIQVEAVSLDSYFEKNGLLGKKCVVKMDIEGYEEFALTPAKKFFSSARAGNVKLFIEFTGSAYKSPEKLFKLLKENFSGIDLIEDSGQRKKLKDYSDLKKITTDTSGDWAMLYCY